MRNIKYETEKFPLVDGDIITLGSRDKYLISIENYEMHIFRYDDGRTVNEKHTYEIVLQNSDDTDIVYEKTNDIILGSAVVAGRWHSLIILRPIFKR